MPMVFSPGESEVRPLNPDEVVYTTAQRIADLLEIDKEDAFLTSADSDTDAVYILGADLRAHGFSAGDSVLVYSDVDPLGKTLTVSSVASSTAGDSAGTGYVKITFTAADLAPATDYQTADNTYVQNQATFTDGKSRGITKAKVDRLILRAQDIIDNKTHNAWRPYLVVGEYINFDTYKPYRRRYYTDYVGTAPLLFRNVQQVLRMELWQGDDYREVGSAECRVKIVDNTLLDTTDYLFLAPGGGGFASLQIGTGTTNWRADFDVLTTAQNLADLVNKESRRGKTALAFSPAFTLEGSSTNVAVHNEFLASANADYGRGIVKITSMRPSAAGETCTVATTNLSALSISQTFEDTATATGAVVAGVLTVDTTDGFANHGLLMTGSETEVFVASYTSLNAATGVLINFAGGYESGQTTLVVDTIDATTVFDIGDSVYDNKGNKVGVLTAVAANLLTFGDSPTLIELSDDEELYRGQFTGVTDIGPAGFTAAMANGVSVFARRLQVDFQGSSSVGDNARLRDWWLDSESGIVYFNNSYPFFEWNAIKAAYIYGERYVEKAIEDVCTKMVAIELLMGDDRSVLIPEGTQNVDLTSKIQLWQRDIDATLPRYREVVVFE